MGAAGSIAAARRERFQRWSMAMVHEVQTVWQKTYGSPFSLKQDEFYKLLRQCPSVQEGLEDVDEFAADTWTVLQEPRVTTIDACGFLGCLAVMCDGDINDKVDVVFNVFDFNKAGSMSKMELTILFLATNKSLAKFAGQKMSPQQSSKRCEALATAAFGHVRGESSDGQKLTKAEFCVFVNKFMEMFKKQGKRHLEDPDSMSAKEKETYSQAATLIQAAARGRSDRKKVKARAEAVERIQAHARGHLARGQNKRRRSVLLNEAAQAVQVDAQSATYREEGVSELVRASADTVDAKDIAEAKVQDRTAEDAKKHAQRLGLVRHALRALHEDELHAITNVQAPDVPTLVLAGALCVVFEQPANWVSASNILRDPEFRNKAARLQSSHLTPKALAIVTKLFTDHNMLVQLTRLPSRVAKILLNWLALLVGLDLPKMMQDGLRKLAKQHAAEEKKAAEEQARQEAIQKAKQARAGAGGDAGAGADSDSDADDEPARAGVTHHAPGPATDEKRAAPMVPAAQVGRVRATLACSQQDKPYLCFARTGLVAIVSTLAGRALHVQCTHALKRTAGQAVAYFEVRALDLGDKRQMAVGLAGKGYNDARLVGWGGASLGYMAESGKKLSGVGSLGTVEQAFGPTWKTGDIIGCGLNFDRRHIFFTVNGAFLGIAARSVKAADQFWPTVSLGEVGQAVFINFGDQPFAFDLNSEVMTRGKTAAGSGYSTGSKRGGRAVVTFPSNSVPIPAPANSQNNRTVVASKPRQTVDKRFNGGAPHMVGGSNGAMYLSMSARKKKVVV